MTSRYNPSEEYIRKNITGDFIPKMFVDHYGNRGFFIPVPGTNDRLFHFMPAPNRDRFFGPPRLEYLIPVRTNVSLVSIMSGEVYRESPREEKHWTEREPLRKSA